MPVLWSCLTILAFLIYDIFAGMIAPPKMVTIVQNNKLMHLGRLLNSPGGVMASDAS